MKPSNVKFCQAPVYLQNRFVVKHYVQIIPLTSKCKPTVFPGNVRVTVNESMAQPRNPNPPWFPQQERTQTSELVVALRDFA